MSTSPIVAEIYLSPPHRADLERRAVTDAQSLTPRDVVKTVPG
jgi:hypothetical protein